MSPEESYQARGLVLFEGNWVTPADRDGVRRERREIEAERRARTERAEAEVRVREAEARAQAAEAEARRAEAERAAAMASESYIAYSPFVPFATSQCCRPPNACPPSAPAPSAPVIVVPPTRRTTRDQGAIRQPKPTH
jgi:hypothetical protein